MRIGILVVAEHAASFFEVDAGNSVMRPIEIVDDLQEQPPVDLPGVSYDLDPRPAIDGDRIAPRWNSEGFARRVAEAIQNGTSRREFERLIVMAAPRMLALIREALPDASRNVIAAEIPNDLARLEAEAFRDHVPADSLRRAAH